MRAEGQESEEQVPKNVSVKCFVQPSEATLKFFPRREFGAANRAEGFPGG